MPKQSMMEQVWESWDWHLRDKLEDANNIVRLIYREATQNGTSKAEYKRFMQAKLAQIFTELGDSK